MAQTPPPREWPPLRADVRLPARQACSDSLQGPFPLPWAVASMRCGPRTAKRAGSSCWAQHAFGCSPPGAVAVLLGALWRRRGRQRTRAPSCLRAPVQHRSGGACAGRLGASSRLGLPCCCLPLQSSALLSTRFLLAPGQRWELAQLACSSASDAGCKAQGVLPALCSGVPLTLTGRISGSLLHWSLGGQ